MDNLCSALNDSIQLFYLVDVILYFLCLPAGLLVGITLCQHRYLTGILPMVVLVEIRKCNDNAFYHMRTAIQGRIDKLIDELLHLCLLHTFLPDGLQFVVVEINAPALHHQLVLHSCQCAKHV